MLRCSDDQQANTAREVHQLESKSFTVDNAKTNKEIRYDQGNHAVPAAELSKLTLLYSE